MSPSEDQLQELLDKQVLHESEVEQMNAIYENLRQHFNQGSLVKLQKSKEIIQILELLFKPEEVDYAIALPLNIQGRVSLEELPAAASTGA